jgi:excisionase family DNA binding protein
MASPLLTTQQAAKELGINRDAIYKLLKIGQLPYRMVGSQRRIAPEDLETFRNKQRQG